MGHGLGAELDEERAEETGNAQYWLGHQTDMDGSSDEEDPEATLTAELSVAKQELEDRSALLEALME